MQDTWERFSKVTIWLHWIVGITIILLLIVGSFMEDIDIKFLLPLHQSFGISILVFVLLRVLWRIKNGWPEPVSVYSRIEQILAKITHWVLIICTLLMPISGMMMSGASGHGFALFGLQIVAANPDPANPGKFLPYNGTAAGIGHEMHEIISTILIIAICLHVAGALKHHVIDKDGTLRRMLGQKISA